MNLIKDLEKQYKKQLLLDYFGYSKTNYLHNRFLKCSEFDEAFLKSLFNTYDHFDDYVFNYGFCDNVDSITTVLGFTNRMLYQMVVQYIIKYCKNNEIPYEVNDGCLVVNGRVLSEGNELFYNVFELDEMLQTIKENNLNCSLKSSLAKAYKDKMDQRFFGNRDCDEIFDKVLNCEIFDYDFVTSFYNDKSSEVCNLVNMGKLPDSLLSVSYIKDASKIMYKDIRTIIFSIMVEYCNRYNIKLNSVDGVITLDDEVIGTDNGYFYDLFELDKKLSLLRKDDKKLI